MHTKRFTRKLQASTILCLLSLGICAASRAQTSAPVEGEMLASNGVSASLPDGPDAAWSMSAGDPQSAQPGVAAQPGDAQPKRIFFIIPNYRSVSAGVHLPPQSVKEKFVTASQDTFDYSALAQATLVATEGYVSNATPEFGKGGVGYSRYLWHSYVDTAVENYMVEFIVPVLTHEDTRFYTLGHGSAKTRTIYALTRVFVTRDDAGKEVFNAGEVIGAGAAAGISDLYYPSGERTVKNTLDKYATNIGIDAASFLLREFDGDIYRKFARKHDAAVSSTP